MTNISLSSLSSLLQQTSGIKRQDNQNLPNIQGNKDVADVDFSDLLQASSKDAKANDAILNSSLNDISKLGKTNPSYPNSFLSNQIDSLNNMYIKADKSQAEVAAGYGDPLQATLDVNRADLNFKLMMEIRNKAIGAFKEITRIQV